MAVLGPLALACWCVFCELRAWGKGAHTAVDILLTPEEEADLERAANVHDALDQDVERVFQHGYSQGFQLRSDGRFDARNPDARSLNHYLEQLLSDRHDAQAALDAVRRRLGRKMDEWLNARSSLIAARVGLAAFIAVFIGVSAYTGASLTPSALLFGTGQDAGSRMLASLTAIVVTLVAVFIARSTVRSNLAR
jgi:hypothetical protein